MAVGDIRGPRRLFTVSSRDTVADAVRVMAAADVGIVLVLEGMRPAGVLSERDVVRRVVDRRFDPAHTPVGDVMTPDVVVADASEDCEVALRRMDRAGIQHLLVMRGCQPTAMVSARDLRRATAPDPGEPLRYLRDCLGDTSSAPAAAR
jgi:CBS domain-containing protein